MAVFAFESEEFGSEGQRRFLVTSYYEFGKRYLYVCVCVCVCVFVCV